MRSKSLSALIGGQRISLFAHRQCIAALVDHRAPGHRQHGFGRPTIAGQVVQLRIFASDVVSAGKCGITRILHEVVIAGIRVGGDIRIAAGRIVGDDRVGQVERRRRRRMIGDVTDSPLRRELNALLPSIVESLMVAVSVEPGNVASIPMAPPTPSPPLPCLEPSAAFSENVELMIVSVALVAESIANDTAPPNPAVTALFPANVLLVMVRSLSVESMAPPLPPSVPFAAPEATSSPKLEESHPDWIDRPSQSPATPPLSLLWWNPFRLPQCFHR